MYIVLTATGSVSHCQLLLRCYVVCHIRLRMCWVLARHSTTTIWKATSTRYTITYTIFKHIHNVHMNTYQWNSKVQLLYDFTSSLCGSSACICTCTLLVRCCSCTVYILSTAMHCRLHTLTPCNDTYALTVCILILQCINRLHTLVREGPPLTVGSNPISSRRVPVWYVLHIWLHRSTLTDLCL
jgi:hypothetical protein